MPNNINVKLIKSDSENICVNKSVTKESILLNNRIDALCSQLDSVIFSTNQANQEVLTRLSSFEFMLATCMDKINSLVKLHIDTVKESQSKLEERLDAMDTDLEDIRMMSTNKTEISSKLLSEISSDKMAGILPPIEQSPYNERLQSKRKFSFPATLHQTSLLEVNLSARRRLSNVSDAVTRKLSYTIGWKPAQIPAQDIITQGKCLCGQYIRRRLRRSGLFNRKLGLQRIRSILGTTSISVVREVFPSIMILGDELERIHPRVYSSVSRQICRAPGGEIQSSEAVILLVSAVARDLFRADITWGKIISLFAVAGGLAVDCVRQGHPDYLPKLIEGVTEVIEDELVPWINENGGWVGLNNHVYPANNDFTAAEWTTLIAGCIMALLVIGITIRLITVYLLPFLFLKSA